MSTGPDGDDEPIEIEPDAVGPDENPEDEAAGPTAPAAAPPEFKHAPLPQAAAERGADADAALYESEVKLQPDARRRAVLLGELGRLREKAGDGGAALEAARAAFATDPSLLAGFWSLRRLLAARAGADGPWDELEAAYGAVLASAPLGPPDRADLLIERGRLSEDRLARDADAERCYREALAADPDHEAALLSLFLLGARTGARDAVETALGGLARRAGSPARAVALSAALARIQREGSDPADDGRALATVEAALDAAPPSEDGEADPPLSPLLRELDLLARHAREPAARARALGQLARRIAAVDPALAAALLRERARSERDDPAAAVETLRAAALLVPHQPGLAAELIDLAERLDRPAVMAEAVAAFQSASPDKARIVDLTLRRAEALGRLARYPEALAALAAPGSATSADPAIAALRAALLVRGRDLGGLADTTEAETAGLSGAAAAWALTFAGAIRQWPAAGSPADAEALYRRALEAHAGYRPAIDALEALLRGEGRVSERAALLEHALAVVVGGQHADPLRETWLREELVALYRDDLGLAEQALAHQRRLAALAPDDPRPRVRLRDLELSLGAPDVDTVLALAADAGDPGVAAALKVEAASLLGTDERAERLLREALPDDATGLAAGALERVLADPAARAGAVADELAGISGQASPEVVRALRFRLAHHQVAAGGFAEAIATLTPLRSEGDSLARAWSWDLARRSGDAILEVAVLSEEATTVGATIVDRGDILVALGEALERAGDPSGAAEAFQRAAEEARPGVPPADAALGMLRVAAGAASPIPKDLPEALQAVVAACASDPALAEAARREAALLRVATGNAEAGDLAATPDADATPAERAEVAVLRWSAGVRRGDAAAVSVALLEMATTLASSGSGTHAEIVPLLLRAALRSRLVGREVAEDVTARVWRASRAPGLAPGLADLPVAPGAGWPVERADPRRARAARAPGPLAVALDLEVALDAERRGALGAALADYGRVIAAEPDRLPAWEGIRRVARAGGDTLGEARALARLATLVKTPARAAALFAEGARLYERAGSQDEAMTMWGKCLEARPDDDHAFGRLRELLVDRDGDPGRVPKPPRDGLERAKPALPRRERDDLAERAGALDRLITHRLGAVTLADDARVALLFERARNRLHALGDTEGAAQDFKRILNIDPHNEQALWDLGHLALAAGGGAAVPFLERFLEVTRDEDQAATARIALAACYEGGGYPARAVEILRRSATMRPTDAAPLAELTELHLRLGDWRSAIETMREWEPRLPGAAARAALDVRIGELLRDAARDSAAAAVAFRAASDLDPMGGGARALVALHDSMDDARGARLAIAREVARFRRALEEDPLDATRLARLGDLLAELGRRDPADPDVAGAIAAASEVRAIIFPAGAGLFPAGAARLREAPARPLALQPRGKAGIKPMGSFWTDLAVPGALGFLAEIWPHLHESAAALHPPPPGRTLGREARIAAGSEPRLGWLEASAAAAGLSGLRFYAAAAGAPADTALPVLEPEPALIVGPAVLEGRAEARFAVGRALSLLRERTVALEWVTPKDLAALYACAALLVGATPPASAALPSDAAQKTVSRVMSRRDRKALALQASRFAFENVDWARWQHAVLGTADRLGLLVAGDVALAARVAGGLDAAAATPEALRANARARELLRFALSEGFSTLRREAGLT